MAKIYSNLVSRIMARVQRIIAIKVMPKNSSLYIKYIDKQYLKWSRLYEPDVWFGGDVTIEYPQLVIYGKGTIVKGGGKWDARGGIILGTQCEIGKGVKINTQIEASNTTTYGPVIIAPFTKIADNKVIKPGSLLGDFDVHLLNEKYESGAKLFFVVSTGRSGSKAIAHLLNKHTSIHCYHDSIAHLNIYACKKMYGENSSMETEDLLKKIFSSISLSTEKTHGFSDQKLSLLIPEIYRLFPKAKFIWLIRKADSFVNAAYSRGWYLNREFNFPVNRKEFFRSEVVPSKMDATHRLNAFKMNLITEREWKKMTAFERNCWYWNWLNHKIENDLNQLPSSQWMMIKLNELNNSSDKLLSFLEVDNQNLVADKVNEAKYKKITKSNWTSEMAQLFELHCGDSFSKWFT